MSKILKNITASPIEIGDTGVTLQPTPTDYTIPPTDYLIWAASSDIVTQIGNGNVVVNDGSFDLSVSDGTDLIKGLFPSEVDVNTVLNPVKVAFDNTVQVNPLGLLRTSSARVLFNQSERYSIEEEFYFDSATLLGGTNTHDENRAARVLAVTDTIGSKVVRQTRRYFRYVKGSPQIIINTGNLKGLVAGVTKTLGYFDEENGIFFRLNGTTPQVGLRSKTSGSVVDTTIDQSEWDDPLDGSGKSGITVDWTKQQFFYFDFAWLGIADIRFGMYLNGKIVIFHTIKNSNSLTTSWSQSAVLPLRQEIENVSGTASTMELTCYAVQTEDGNTVEDGSFKTTSFGATTQTAGTAEQVFFGIRINPLYKGNLDPQDYATIVPSGNSTVYFKFLLNPVLTGATWVDIPDSIAQRLGNQPTFSGGHIVDEGYSQVGASSITRQFKASVQLGKGITEQDTLVLVVRTLGGNSALLLSNTWREDT